jgi:hypothetical protein
VLTVAFALAVSGSFRDYFFWCFTIPYLGNMFLFRVDPYKFFWGKGWEAYREMALVSLVGGAASVTAGLVPRRGLAVAALPAGLFLGAVMQGRGYLYQVAPVSAAATLLALIGLGSLWGQPGPWSGSRGALATLALALVAWHFFATAEGGPYVWTGDAAQWTKSAHHFDTVERQVGLYVKEHTKPDDELFVYTPGGDAHVVLFSAERRTASTFFHSFWLDPIGLLPLSENQPNAQERAGLEKLAATTRARTCAEVTNRPPAGMVFTRLPDAFAVCPPLRDMLTKQYAEATTLGIFHVYLRRPGGS